MYYMTVVCENIVDAVPEVVKWNSWDGEHLRTVHNAYYDPRTLMQREGESLFVDFFKVPVLGFRFRSLVFGCQWDNTRQVSFTLTPFFLAKNTIELIKLKEKQTMVRVTYDFEGNLIQSWTFPLVKRYIKKWNKQVWEEDLPLKLRRQKALEYGFTDFKGLPRSISERVDKSLSYTTKVPVARVKGIIEDSHPFYIKK